MKSIRKGSLLKVLILTVAAMGASAIPAHAQAATGTFTLAHKAYWGGAVLLPGNYAFSVQSLTWPARVTVREIGGPTVAMILPRMISEVRMMNASSLVLHEEGGESVVSALRIANLGLVLEFASPKSRGEETARLGPIAQSQPLK
jgi:hypothetical protein